MSGMAWASGQGSASGWPAGSGSGWPSPSGWCCRRVAETVGGRAGGRWRRRRSGVGSGVADEPGLELGVGPAPEPAAMTGSAAAAIHASRRRRCRSCRRRSRPTRPAGVELTVAPPERPRLRRTRSRRRPSDGIVSAPPISRIQGHWGTKPPAYVASPTAAKVPAALAMRRLTGRERSGGRPSRLARHSRPVEAVTSSRLVHRGGRCIGDLDVFVGADPPPSRPRGGSPRTSMGTAASGCGSIAATVARNPTRRRAWRSRARR